MIVQVNELDNSTKSENELLWVQSVNLINNLQKTKSFKTVMYKIKQFLAHLWFL